MIAHVTETAVKKYTAGVPSSAHGGAVATVLVLGTAYETRVEADAFSSRDPYFRAVLSRDQAKALNAALGAALLDDAK